MNKITVQSPFNPLEARDLSALSIGGHVVTRKSQPGTFRLVYSTMHGSQVAGSQLSYPTPDDCRRHFQRFDDALTGRPKRGPSAVELARGTMTERIVQLVATASKTDSQLASELATSTGALSPILNRLVRAMRIQRSGKAGNYLYTTATTPALPAPTVPVFTTAQ